ncbi:MAG TPA: LysE family translocator [Actinomycetota bacterium]|nr:LysE family translocator [Actinomycetota bacterium]
MGRQVAALVGFAFVGSFSPGPNNAVLWASGMRFGFRRTMPHVLATGVGIDAIALGVAAGLGVVFREVPAVETALKVAGSIYLLYLAVVLVRSGGLGRADPTRPFGFGRAIGFQIANPKAWVFAVIAVGAFVPTTVPRPTGVAVLLMTLIVVVAISSALWAAGGAGLGRLVADERSRRIVNVVLALLLVVSVVLIWL